MSGFEIREDPERLQAFCKVIGKKGMGDDLYLISTNIGNQAYLAISLTGASSIALKVDVKGDPFTNCALKLTNSKKPFVKTVKEYGSATIEIPTGTNSGGTFYQNYKLYDPEGNRISIFGSDFTWDLGFNMMSNTAKALSGNLYKEGKIHLPNRIGRDKGVVFDLRNHRYGVCKVNGTEFNYLFSEVRELDVVRGTVVACYYGKTAAKLPWKKGLEAGLFVYPTQSWRNFQYMLRYEIDGVVVLLMPVNPDSNREHYVGVFGEDMP